MNPLLFSPSSFNQISVKFYTFISLFVDIWFILLKGHSIRSLVCILFYFNQIRMKLNRFDRNSKLEIEIAPITNWYIWFTMESCDLLKHIHSQDIIMLPT